MSPSSTGFVQSMMKVCAAAFGFFFMFAAGIALAASRRLWCKRQRRRRHRRYAGAAPDTREDWIVRILSGRLTGSDFHTLRSKIYSRQTSRDRRKGPGTTARQVRWWGARWPRRAARTCGSTWRRSWPVSRAFGSTEAGAQGAGSAGRWARVPLPPFHSPAVPPPPLPLAWVPAAPPLACRLRWAARAPAWRCCARRLM